MRRFRAPAAINRFETDASTTAARRGGASLTGLEADSGHLAASILDKSPGVNKLRGWKSESKRRNIVNGYMSGTRILAGWNFSLVIAGLFMTSIRDNLSNDRGLEPARGFVDWPLSTTAFYLCVFLPATLLATYYLNKESAQRVGSECKAWVQLPGVVEAEMREILLWSRVSTVIHIVLLVIFAASLLFRYSFFGDEFNGHPILFLGSVTMTEITQQVAYDRLKSSETFKQAAAEHGFLRLTTVHDGSAQRRVMQALTVAVCFPLMIFFTATRRYSQLYMMMYPVFAYSLVISGLNIYTNYVSMIRSEPLMGNKRGQSTPNLEHTLTATVLQLRWSLACHPVQTLKLINMLIRMLCAFCFMLPHQYWSPWMCKSVTLVIVLLGIWNIVLASGYMSRADEALLLQAASQGWGIGAGLVHATADVLDTVIHDKALPAGFVASWERVSQCAVLTFRRDTHWTDVKIKERKGTRCMRVHMSRAQLIRALEAVMEAGCTYVWCDALSIPQSGIGGDGESEALNISAEIASTLPLISKATHTNAKAVFVIEACSGKPSDDRGSGGSHSLMPDNSMMNFNTAIVPKAEDIAWEWVEGIKRKPSWSEGEATSNSGSSRGSDNMIEASMNVPWILTQTPVMVGVLKIDYLVGAGFTSKVYKGKWMGGDVAAKVIILDKLPEDVRGILIKGVESTMLHRIAHPNVVQTFAVYHVKPDYTKVSELWIVQEWCEGGDLSHNFVRWPPDLLCDVVSFPALNVRGLSMTFAQVPGCKGEGAFQKMVSTIKDVVRALKYLHILGIVHGDLKPANVLTGRDTATCKVTDFGLAHVLLENQDYYVSSSVAGDWNYLAPEVLMHSRISAKMDTYALGVTMYEMYYGFDRLSSAYSATMASHALWLCSGQRPKFDPGVPKEFEVLVERCWATDPDDRPTDDDVLASLESMITGLETNLGEVSNTNTSASLKMDCSGPDDRYFSIDHMVNKKVS